MSDTVILRSMDRSEGSTTDGNIILSEINKLKGTYEVVKFIMLNALYNVSLRNRNVYFTESGVPRQAILTQGFFTAEELGANLELSMNAVGSNTYTVTYDQNTHKYVVTSTGDFAFDFVNNIVDSAYRLLGYSQQLESFEATAQESIYAIDLNPNSILYFNSFDGSNSLVDSADNYASFYIDVEAGFGDMIRQDLSGESIVFDFNNKRNFTYTIADYNKRTLSNANGAEWFLVLRRRD